MSSRLAGMVASPLNKMNKKIKIDVPNLKRGSNSRVIRRVNKSKSLCNASRDPEKELRSSIAGHLDWFLKNMTDLFCMRFPELEERNALLELWLVELSRCGIESTVKWFYASLFSFCTDQPRPSGPDFSLLHLLFPVPRIRLFVRGVIRRCRSDIRSGTKAKMIEGLEKASTIANFKKGAPAPSVDMVAKTLAKHCSALTSSESLNKGIPSRDNFLDSEVSDLDLKRTITQVVREVFKGKSFPKLSDPKYIPSMNGHFDSSRNDGGATPALLDFLRLIPGSLSELNRMDYHPRVGVISSYGRFAPVFSQEFQEFCSKEEQEKSYSDFEKSLENFNAKPCAIREPLKVRVVTSGPSLNYFLAIFMQKFLWKSVGSFENFELITKPISAEVLQNFFSSRDLSGDWCSGDYSAATDNLRSSLSLHCWNEIAEAVSMPNCYRRLGAKALVGHKLFYNPKKVSIPVELSSRMDLEDGLLSAPQTNGQLMGSPLSFPILCLINAAVCLLAYQRGEWACGGTRLIDSPIMINGDDCLMNYTNRQYKLWEKISSLAGLTPSIGKTYFHKSMVQMNSTNYIVSDGQFFECPFVNVSLLTEYTTRGMERRHWSALGSISRAFKASCGKWVKDPMNIFIKRHKHVLLKEAPTWVNWQICEALGGLGIPLNRGPESVTYRQRQLASSLYLQSEAGNPVQRFSQQKTVPVWALKASAYSQQYATKVGEGLEDTWVGLFPANLNGFMLRQLRISLLNNSHSDLSEQELSEDISHRRFWDEMEKAKGLENHRLLSCDEILNYVGPVLRVPDHVANVFLKNEPLSFGGLYQEFETRVCRKAVGIPFGSALSKNSCDTSFNYFLPQRAIPMRSEQKSEVDALLSKIAGFEWFTT